MTRFKVRLKSTVMWWEEVEIDEAPYDQCLDRQAARELAANDAVDLAGPEQRAQVVVSGECEWGPIELAYEELDESVKEA